MGLKPYSYGLQHVATLKHEETVGFHDVYLSDS